MIIEIAKTDYYSFTIDKVRNRVYATLVGFWKSPDDVPQYLDDLRKAADAVNDDFTVLVDATKLNVPPQEVAQLHVEGQKIFYQKKVVKVAQLIPQSALIKMTVDRLSGERDVPHQKFYTREEAEAWLDEKEI